MKSIIFFLLGLFSFNIVVYSQNDLNYDQLIEKIENSTFYDSIQVYENGKLAIAIAKKENDLSKVALVYQNYGKYNYLLGKHDIAAAYYDTSTVYAREIGDTTLIYSIKIRKNFNNLYTRTEEALQNFREYYHVSKARGDTNNMVFSLNGLASCNELKYKPNQALINYLEAFDLASSAKDNYLQAMLLSNIGLIKFQNQQYDKALEDFQRGIELSKDLKNVRLKFYLHNNIGLVYEQLGMLDKSIQYFQNSLERANEIGFPYTRAITHLNLSNAYQKLNEPNLAILHADSAYLIFINQNEMQHIAKPFLIKVESHLIKENYDLALELIDSALYYAKINTNLEDVLLAYKLKSKVYKKLNRFEEALETYMFYSHLRDSTEEVSNQRQFSELQVIYDTERKEAELKEERSRISILEKDNKLYQSRVAIIVSLSISIFLFGIVFFYLRHVQVRRKQQVHFSHQLIKNIDDERSRISKDLHDDIGQSLSVAKSKINLFNKGQLSNIDDMESSLGDLIQQVRVLSHELHPSFLEKIGLKRSVISLLDKIEKDTKLITSFNLSDGIDNLSLETQNQLYRITQESINNTIKHADAKSIKVTIKEEGNNFIYIYRDNGKGFDPSVKTGFGVSAMKERSSKIGGRFSIHSQLNKGLKIIIKFPKT
ncbi:MAG TPA: tetratricopeptide repeat protein [Brumimicrobium sp.]|nr:tetratricopeptide repeat protein [Brumimicrobium sp.]